MQSKPVCSLADTSVRTMIQSHSPSNATPHAARLSRIPGRAPRPRIFRSLAIRFLRTRHNDRAAGVADNRVGDTAHQHPADNAPTPSAHDDQVDLQFLGQTNHFFCHLSYPEVSPGHGPAGDLLTLLSSSQSLC